MLSQNILATKFLDVFDKLERGIIQVSNPPNPPPPGMAFEVATALAQAYDSWARSATAGPLVSIVTPGSLSGLISSLVSVSSPPAFSFAGWSVGFSLYWSPVTFTGPNFITVNPVIPVSVVAGASGILSDFTNMIQESSNGVSPASKDDSAVKIAAILHSWTTKLQVLGTTTSSPPVISNFTVS